MFAFFVGEVSVAEVFSTFGVGRSDFYIAVDVGLADVVLDSS